MAASWVEEAIATAVPIEEARANHALREHPELRVPRNASIA